jgi:hypothetical protein
MSPSWRTAHLVYSTAFNQTLSLVTKTTRKTGTRSPRTRPATCSARIEVRWAHGAAMRNDNGRCSNSASSPARKLKRTIYTMSSSVSIDIVFVCPLVVDIQHSPHALLSHVAPPLSPHSQHLRRMRCQLARRCRTRGRRESIRLSAATNSSVTRRTTSLWRGAATSSERGLASNGRKTLRVKKKRSGKENNFYFSGLRTKPERRLVVQWREYCIFDRTNPFHPRLQRRSQRQGCRIS